MRYSHSLERGLAILECFTPARPVWGIAEIADGLEMSRSTTHRYMLTLTALGYLVRAKGRRYRLGLAVTKLGMGTMNGMSLAEQARPYMQALGDRTGLTVGLGVLDGPEVLIVECVRDRRRAQPPAGVDLAPGSKLPAYCTAIGKLLLAHLPEREQRLAVAQIRLAKRAPNTLTRKAALWREIERLRRQNLAACEEELAPGLCSVAAPVRTATGEVYAATGMDAHRSVITQESLVNALGPHLISTADQISARLGYRRKDERPSYRAGEPTPMSESRSVAGAQGGAVGLHAASGDPGSFQ